MRTERLRDGHPWLRVADPAWANPLDPSFAARRGGRWNPPDSHPTLYLNEDLATAWVNLTSFVAAWPYGPEDLRDDTAPVLVTARLPRDQRVADAHTSAGIVAVGLPPSYPLDESGALVPPARCQPMGIEARSRGLRGVRCRSAGTSHGSGRELAWFPATARSRARLLGVTRFSEWYWPAVPR